MRAGLAIAIAVSLAQSRPPSLKDVLARAGGYVAHYHETMISVIAEERYVQKWTIFPAPAPTKERTLVSDFVLLSGGPGEPRWMSFRDVLEVDGVPVRERDDRLQKLFASGDDAVNRGMALSLESSRYNIGPPDFVRTINTPIVAIDFLLPETRPRFSFRRKARDKASDPALWEVEYTERDRPTVIRTPRGQSLPSRGRFLIDSTDGRIVESTLEVPDVHAEVTVTYGVEPRLQVAVPLVMTEHYDASLGHDRIDAQATYSKYRRFETGVRIVPR
jgi:hypothetical protein